MINYSILLIILIVCMIVFSCSNKLYQSNGESIYNTGKNLRGEKLLDRSASSIRTVNSCKTCHGKNGDRMNKVSIKFSDLSDAKQLPVPYNDSLFFRFMDHELKSDGTKANIGVIWKMNQQDKKDLLDYLKSL